MASSQGHLVNDSATFVLKFSKGVMRVPLEHLGPALFNRRGAATCGQHCLKLAERILNMEGFATFRYVAGFCHEPNPDEPLSVARHGNAMQAADAVLPRLPMQALKGVFAKTHLVTFLQMYKAGLLPNIKLKASSFSDKGNSVAVPRSLEELHDVLEHGIFMQVFPWSVVRDHKEAVIALMASDNFDHGHGLTDSEIRCIQAVREAIAASSQGSLPVPPGLTQWDVVLRHVMQMSGQRWREQDIGFFWDFAKSTLEGQFEVIQDVWTFAGCESVLRVEAAWFGAVAKVNPKFQWTRASIVVAHCLSDKETECSVVGGQCIAGAINKNVAKKVRERDAAFNQEWEDWMQAVLFKYWTAWTRESRPIANDVGVGAVAAFLDRTGRFAANASTTATTADVDDKKSKFEAKLRAALEPGWSGTMPEPIMASSQEKKKESWTAHLDAEPPVVADSQGRPVVSVKREAQEKHLDVGARVTAKRQRKNELEEIAEAIITEISDKGVVIKWEGGKGTFPVSAIELAKEKEKDELPEDMLQHEAMKWSQCSTVENAEMLLHVIASTLYNVYVARSSAHEDLHVINIKGDVQLFATKEMKPGALVLLPFGALESVPDPKAAGVPVVLEIGGEKSGQTTQVEYQIRPKNTPKKATVTQEQAVVLVPFWVLATKPVAINEGKAAAVKAASSKAAAGKAAAGKAASSQVVSVLQYKTTAVNVPAAPALEKRGTRSKASIVLKTICLTNKEVVPKGSRLIVSEKPPVKLQLPA